MVNKADVLALMIRTWSAQAHDIAEAGREAIAAELVAQTAHAACATDAAATARWLRAHPTAAMRLAMSVAKT